MNYYEHHLGDYLRDTAHLSVIEDGIYRRLIDQYYIREKPLPLDAKECCKLARAASVAERKAVAYVLESFFTKAPDGYRQTRCDAEIARFTDKRTKAKASASARWNGTQSVSERNANASPNAMRTHSEGICDGNALQTPDSSHQTPEKKLRSSSVGDLSPSSSSPGPDGLKNREEIRRAVAGIGRFPS